MTTTAPPGSLGAYIRAKRIEAEMLQKELAERVGYAQGAVSYWEAGAAVPSAKAVSALARELPGASVEEMLRLIEEGS